MLASRLINLAIGVIMVLGGTPFHSALFQTEFLFEDGSDVASTGISQFFGQTSLYASSSSIPSDPIF